MSKAQPIKRRGEARAKFDLNIDSPQLQHLTRHIDEAEHVRIENCIGFVQVPVGIAGPLRITGPDTTGEYYAPLATCEPTLVASCSRGCKVFNACGGLQFEVLNEAMSRAPMFLFASPAHAVAFARAVPSFRNEFARWAESTSRYVRLQELQASVIGSSVHLFCSYFCGNAAGQNMVSKATQYACEMLRGHRCAKQFQIQDFLIEGQLASDKKPSWGNVQRARGVEVLAWGTITNAACQEILGCSTERLYRTQMALKEGGIRNGQFGCNINTTNILAAIFVSTGQDAGSVAEASWSHLTSEYDYETKELKMTLYFPSLPVGTVGGGTLYPSQKECLDMLGCAEPSGKRRLAGMIAAFAVALDASTSAAIANDTFTMSHMKLARGEIFGRQTSKL
ncbi:hmg-CoA reductase [Aspergillus nomiae NRRL 13137]|uniref:hydroxymethylglutaryl-CoA reductase (NADPH) n=1 Tax=Aspergillus nomiae NRRL (strain ATCC 15546 / NRRL 13137 / CBS 260.88 / M93) TaxID=1509407 RepID=A0A0L1IMH8_ASPN3|nr:hmg-CoA reductase [Aspergillus nomiae NRRL 13137]KNG80789.1 hmg-CoA reductase [Aspergillus nomiae NRRL 13137]